MPESDMPRGVARHRYMQITVYLTPAEYDELVKQAIERALSISDVAQEAVCAHLEASKAHTNGHHKNGQSSEWSSTLQPETAGAVSR